MPNKNPTSRENFAFMRIPTSHNVKNDCAIKAKCVVQPKLRINNENALHLRQVSTVDGTWQNSEQIFRSDRPLVIKHTSIPRGFVSEAVDSEPEPEPRSSAGIKPLVQHAELALPVSETDPELDEELSLTEEKSETFTAKSCSLLSVPTLNSSLALRRKVAEAERSKAAAVAAMEAQVAAERRRLESDDRIRGESQQNDLQCFKGLVPILEPVDALGAAAAGNVVVLVPRRVGKQVDARWQAALRDPPPFDALNLPVPPRPYRSVPPLPRPELDPPFSLASSHGNGGGGSLDGSAFPGNAQLLHWGGGEAAGFSPAALSETPDDWW